MIQLVVTANNTLYERLAQKAQKEAISPIRATNVLDGFKMVAQQSPQSVIVDMALHAADTLVETLHSRPETAHIPIYAVKTNGRLPFELRRLCTDILEADAL